MSASREKKARFEQRAEGKEKRQVRAKDNQKRAKRKKLITTVAVTVVVLLLVVLVVFNSTLFYTGVPALRIGNQGYTAADFNYEYFASYYTTYQNIYNTYGEYTSYLLDSSQPLDKQYYSETQSWADYFEENAINQLQQMTMLNDMAKAEGWSLSAEQAAEIETTIDQVKTDAVSQGYSDYKAYLKALYGKGFTEERLRELLRKSFNATYYSQELVERWKNAATEEEKLEYYRGVQETYNLISFMLYHVDGSANDEEGIDAETAMLAAKNTADEIAATADQYTFADAVYRLAPEDQRATYADQDACLTRNAAPSNIDSTYRSWLTGGDRVYGDTTVLESGSGYDVLMFLESNDNSFHLVNYRGIVIQAETDENGNVTDQTRAEAQEKVDAILASMAEDPSEENFAQLANDYNGSGVNGGLQENVIPGTLKSYALEQYFFDGEERQPGDLYSFYEDGTFYIAYFVSYGAQYNLQIAANLIAQDQYTGLVEAGKADYPVKKLFAFRFTK